MTIQNHRGLKPAFACMELFWLFTWADFMLGFTAKLPVSFISFFAAYFFSFALASEIRRRNLRFIWVILGHALLFCSIASFAVWSVTGKRFFFGTDVFQWYQSCLIWALAGFFWYKGAKLSSRRMSYKMVCNYFDLGMALFFALLFLKLLIWHQAGIRFSDPFFLYALTGFFFTGLAAIFFSSTSTTRNKQYVEGFRGIGVLISFCAVFLLCGMGLVFVLMPFLTSMAESGYTVLKEVSGPLGPYLIAALRFILVVPKTGGEAAATRPDPDAQGPEHAWIPGEPGWFTHFLLYGVLLILGVAALILIGAIVWRVFRFLMLRSAPLPDAGERESLWSWARLFFGAVMNFFRKIIFIFSSRIETAHTGFSRLMAWGRKSGVPKGPAETPGEYAK
ncbi:MAG: hypothetical protein WC836_17195, partial [Desulfobacula sp.]